MNSAFLMCYSCSSRFVKVESSPYREEKAVICQSCGCMAEADNFVHLSDNWVLKTYTIQPRPLELRIPEEELERRYRRRVPSLSELITSKSVEQSAFDFGGDL